MVSGGMSFWCQKTMPRAQSYVSWQSNFVRPMTNARLSGDQARRQRGVPTKWRVCLGDAGVGNAVHAVKFGAQERVLRPNSMVEVSHMRPCKRKTALAPASTRRSASATSECARAVAGLDNPNLTRMDRRLGKKPSGNIKGHLALQAGDIVDYIQHWSRNPKPRGLKAHNTSSITRRSGVS